jgi:oligopeptidase A
LTSNLTLLKNVNIKTTWEIDMLALPPDLPDTDMTSSVSYKEEQSISNPCFDRDKWVPFDQIRPSHFTKALDLLIQKIFPKISYLEEDETLSCETLLSHLEDIEEEIHRVIGPMRHLKAVMDSPSLRQAWAEVEPRLVKLTLSINQSPPLFRAYKKIYESKEFQSLPRGKKRILEQRLREAKLSGVALRDDQKEAFNSLISRLNELQSAYMSNLLDAMNDFSLVIKEKKHILGIPEDILRLASDAYNRSRKEKDPVSTAKSGPWKLTLNSPIYTPVMKHCQSRKTRKQLFHGHMRSGSSAPYDNSDNLYEQLILRKKMAHLLGFDSYAHLSLSKKMAPDVETVRMFLHDLREAAREPGQRDLQEVKDFAKSFGFNRPFMPWDYPFWSERLRESTFDLPADSLKNYFPLPQVLNGLFELCHTLFGISVHPAKDTVPTWHPDVSYYRVHDRTGQEIASFYLDPYSRPETKRGGAWMDSCRNRRKQESKEQTPIAYVTCNATPPFDTTPSLLSFREVQTLFHEFGHALQHMLTQIEDATISGINGVEWDAVEIPSQFMENWCYHRPTLKKITSHYMTKEPIPDELIDKITSSRQYQAGFTTLTQVVLGTVDLELHDELDEYKTLNPFQLYHLISEKTTPLPSLKADRFLCSFHHLFGDNDYAAGYYSYKWAEVLSADAFSAFEEAGLEDEEALREVGMRFKETFLELGGSLPPMEVFKIFRGRTPSLEPLLKQSGFIH